MSEVLQEKLFGILERPKCVTDIKNELGLKGVILSNVSYIKGYLDSLVDINKLHSEDIGNRIVMYSTNPIPEHVTRKCTCCNQALTIFQTDVGTTINCNKCKSRYNVVLSIKKGVELVKVDNM